MLGERKRFVLDYSGPGCGGCNLPFDGIDAALAYAAERGAREATVSLTATLRVVRKVTRPDARYKWRETPLTGACDHGAAGVVTCGGCGRRWCEGCDPAPSALCHYCHGRGYSEAPRGAAERD